MLRRSCATLALLFSCFTATARQAEVPMPIADTLAVEIVESQHELAVVVPDTAAAVGMQFGLIGALIGSGIQNAQAKHAEAAVVPMRDLLVEYGFNEKMEAALRAKLAAEGISSHPSITVLRTPWDAVDAQHAPQVPLQALVLTPRYTIDNAFRTLSVRLTAQLVDRTVKSNGKIKASERFNRSYVFQFPLQGEASDDPVRPWTAMGGARLAELLDQGIAQASDMLVFDFSAAGRAQWGQLMKGQSVTVAGLHYDGLPVRQGNDWAWVRVGKRRLESLQGYQPVQSVVAAAPAAVAHDVPVGSDENAAAPPTESGATPAAPATGG